MSSSEPRGGGGGGCQGAAASVGPWSGAGLQPKQLLTPFTFPQHLSPHPSCSPHHQHPDTSASNTPGLAAKGEEAAVLHFGKVRGSRSHPSRAHPP